MGLDPVRVLIVDDQAPFRIAARTVVKLSRGFEVVAEAESGEDGVAQAAEIKPDLVLMDINLPGIDGIESVRRILAASPGIVAFLLSTYQVGDLPGDARTCGAAAYIHKEDFSPALLRELWDAGGDALWRAS